MAAAVRSGRRTKWRLGITPFLHRGSCAAALQLALWIVANAETRCLLKTLGIRSAQIPIDLVPQFSSETYEYTATMDFAMRDFSVDARPKEGCMVDGVPNHAIQVPRGDTSILTILAKDPDTSSRQAYVLKLKRLKGSETEMMQVRVDGAELTPAFIPEVRTYRADLDIGHDFVTFMYTLLDSGQKVKWMADTGDAIPNGRRQLLAGEFQRMERSQSFLIDVGQTRKVTIALESADSMQSNVGWYTVLVTRASCTVARPFYSPMSRSCTAFCPEGHYPNLVSSRCSKCNTNCAVCRSLGQCNMCMHDTLRHKYSVQPDGSCSNVIITVEDKYAWWCVGFAVFVGLLVCMGLAFLCDCIVTSCCRTLCCCCCDPPHSPRVAYSDSDE